jgi:predicted esterase
VSYVEQRLAVARTARWGLIGALDTRTTDVWIILHGYGQLAEGIASSATWPEAANRAFVFPEALQRFYDESRGPRPHSEARVGASWMTRHAREEDIADNLAYLDSLASVILTLAPSAHLTVLGFSQGTATASRWAEHRAAAGNPPRRLIAWGGLIAPEVDLGKAAPLRAVDVLYVAGSRDRWATAEKVNAERARLDAAGFVASWRTFAGGHRLDDDLLAELAI